MSEIQSALILPATDPNDLSFLIAHLRQLPEEARRYIIWVSEYVRFADDSIVCRCT